MVTLQQNREPDIIAQTFSGVALFDIGNQSFKIGVIEDSINLDDAVLFENWSELAELFTKAARSFGFKPDIKKISDLILPENLRNFLSWLPDWKATPIGNMEDNRLKLELEYLGMYSSNKDFERITHNPISLGEWKLENQVDGSLGFFDNSNNSINPILSTQALICLTFLILSDKRTYDSSPNNYGPFLLTALEKFMAGSSSASLAKVQSNPPIADPSNTPNAQPSLAAQNLPQRAGVIQIKSHADWLEAAKSAVKNIELSHELFDSKIDI